MVLDFFVISVHFRYHFSDTKTGRLASFFKYFVRKFRHSYLPLRQFMITLIIISFSSGLDSAIMIVSATRA